MRGVSDRGWTRLVQRRRCILGDKGKKDKEKGQKQKQKKKEQKDKRKQDKQPKRSP